MARSLSIAGAAAANDLGLNQAGGPGSNQNLSEEEMLKRKKLKMMQATQQSGVNSGAFMSLAGNQY